MLLLFTDLDIKYKIYGNNYRDMIFIFRIPFDVMIYVFITFKELTIITNTNN